MGHLPSKSQYPSYGLEDKSEEYENCSVLYCVYHYQIVLNYMHTHMRSSYRYYYYY